MSAPGNQLSGAYFASDERDKVRQIAGRYGKAVQRWREVVHHRKRATNHRKPARSCSAKPGTKNHCNGEEKPERIAKGILQCQGDQECKCHQDDRESVTRDRMHARWRVDSSPHELVSSPQTLGFYITLERESGRTDAAHILTCDPRGYVSGVTRVVAWRSSSCMTFMSAPFAFSSVEYE